MITIRQATQGDIVRVAILNNKLFEEDSGQRDPTVNHDWAKENGRFYFADFLAKNGRCCWLAELNGEGVGYLAGYTQEKDSYHAVKTAELESMYVLAPFRSQGIGRQLATKFIDWAQDQGAQAITVTAYATNTAAINFYHSLGFVPKQLTLALATSAS